MKQSDHAGMKDYCTIWSPKYLTPTLLLCSPFYADTNLECCYQARPEKYVWFLFFHHEHTFMGAQ